nr:hypothetical protein GGBNIMDK_00124 [Bacillus cereus]
MFQYPKIENAILDRLLHHATAVSIEGQSYRIKGHFSKENYINMYILTCQDIAKQWDVGRRDTVVIQKQLMKFSLLIDVQF